MARLTSDDRVKKRQSLAYFEAYDHLSPSAPSKVRFVNPIYSPNVKQALEMATSMRRSVQVCAIDPITQTANKGAGAGTGVPTSEARKKVGQLKVSVKKVRLSAIVDWFYSKSLFGAN